MGEQSDLKKLTLATKQKDLNKNPSNKIVLLGILQDEEGKILLVKNAKGLIFLPGGTSKKYDDKQKLQETLIKFIWQKSGVLVEKKDILGFREKNKKTKIIIYSLKRLNPDEYEATWRRNHNYQPVWLTPEQIAAHDKITVNVKKIIDGFFNNKLQSIAPL